MDSNNLNEKEIELYEYNGPDKVISSHELDELMANDPEPKKVASGIPTMDRILNNLEAGELIVVTGPAGHGKTTFLTTVSSNMAEKDIKSVWFTLEVTPRQFVKKMKARHDKLPLFWLPKENTENNIKWLINRIIEAKVKHNVDAVFIDHLHQIFSVDRYNGKNLSLEIGDIVAKIKQIALQFNLVIFLVAHSTDDKQNRNKEPSISSFRDSGMINRLADVALGVWRIPNDDDGTSNKLQESFGEDDNRAKMRIWKNRREGKLGYAILEHENHYFKEIDIDFVESKKIAEEAFKSV